MVPQRSVASLWSLRGRVGSIFCGLQPASGIERQRPICNYPRVARHNGTGDVNQAGSFSCQAPSVNALAPTAAELEQVRNSLRLRGVLIPAR